MKKAMKIVLILLGVILILLIAVIFYIKSKLPNGGGNNDITEGYYERFQSDEPLEMRYANPGSFETSCTEFTSDNESIGKVRVWYPTELESSGKSWPMIMVVNASGTPASSYEPFFPRLASWGFVVVVRSEYREEGVLSYGRNCYAIEIRLLEPETILSSKVLEYEANHL